MENFSKILNIMRISTLFLFICVFATFAENTRSQNAIVNISEANITIAEFIDQVETQTDYLFVYSKNELNTGEKTSLKAGNKTVAQCLSETFGNTGIKYVFENEYIVLTTKDISITQQSRKQITGTVIDEQGEPVIGANIVEKGAAANGTITDVDGQFSLSVADNAVLQISYIGYISQEITVGNRTQLRIVLAEDARALEEVVIVGYGVQKKRDLTGAISSVKVAEMPVQTYSTISHALAGKAAGLQVTQVSAQVGGGSKFRIRGETSVGAGNEPLVIIDGFPVSMTSNDQTGSEYANGAMDNILESLNPNDIESIEVLKDASATAIYGSRAGHGVILVTTKRGKGQKATVTYSGNRSVQQISKNYEMLDAKGYMRHQNRLLYEHYLRSNALSVYAPYITLNPGHITPEYTPLYSEQEIAGAQGTDWMKEITRTGVQQSHNISMMGGNESLRYLTSLNYFSQKGVVKNNNMDRFTAKLNLDQQLSRYVKAGLTLNLSRNQYDSPAIDGYYTGMLTAAVEFNPVLPVYDQNGNYSKDPRRGSAPNPMSLLEITDKSTKDRALGMVYVEAEPLKGLILKTSLGIDRRNSKRKTYYPRTTDLGAGRSGWAGVTESNALDYLMDLTATYAKEIAQHNFTFLAGYSWQGFNNENFSASNSNFILDSFLYNNLGVGANRPVIGSSANKNALGSYFTRVNYSFLGRYLLTATMRADGASNFDPDYRWGYFPSASLGWRFSDEAFMQPFAKWFSNGKIRAGYGQTGNSNIGNRTMNTYAPTEAGYDFGDTYYLGIGASQLGNPKLKWETTSELNIGLDLGFLNGRINLTAEYYDRIISDLLSEQKLLSYNEIPSIAANIGKTQGRGFELTLNTVNMVGKDFQWSTDLTYSFYRDRWKERHPEWKAPVYMSATDPLRAIYAILPDGLMQPGETQPEHQRSLLPGQVKLKDISGEDGVPDGKLNDYDYVYLGVSTPDFYFGLNNTLQYKNFDFNIYFYGEVNRTRGGGYYYNGYWALTGQNVSTIAPKVWYHDNQDSKYYSLIESDTGSGGAYYLRDISFLRCRNITLGYTLPLPKDVIQRTRVYVDVNNPFVITNWDGLDPETDGGSYNFPGMGSLSFTNPFPNVTSFTFGVDITF
jgi:TonB-linked SusC/RagA family outer membrane protein